MSKLGWGWAVAGGVTVVGLLALLTPAEPAPEAPSRGEARGLSTPRSSPLSEAPGAPPAPRRTPPAAGRRGVVAERMREAQAAEAAEEAARAELLGIDAGAPLSEQLERFLERLVRLTGRDPREEGEALTRGPATELFLRQEAVQAHLRELSEPERRAALREIRRGFGHPEAHVLELELEDRHRDARWENGHAYMRARAALEARRLEGEAFEAELAELRARYFEHEAPTIAREEEAGFFRYRRRRVYGRN